MMVLFVQQEQYYAKQFHTSVYVKNDPVDQPILEIRPEDVEGLIRLCHTFFFSGYV